MKSKFTTLSPEYAEKLLESTKGNRKISSNTVEKYAEDIRRGKWVENGVPIIMNGDGSLLDGQHRCAAVMRAGRSIPVMIVSGVVDKHAFATYDTGRNRKLPDVLYMKNEHNYVLLSSSLNLLNEYQHRTDAGLPSKKMTNQEGISLLRQNGGLRDSVTAADSWRKRMLPGLIRPSILVVIHFEGTKLRKRKTEEFIGGLCLGEGLSGGSPILVLREKLLRAKTGEGFTRQDEQLAWTIKAWNAYAAGGAIQNIRWSRGTREAFPSFHVKT